MRIYKLVFGGLLLAGIVMVLLWFGFEKMMMGVAAYSLKSDMEELSRLKRGNSVSQLCESDGGRENRLVGYQLRFISESEYVLETVCESFQTNQIIKTAKLKAGVKRLYGAGIMVPTGGEDETVNGWVHLVFGKTITAVGFFDNELKIHLDAKALPIGGDDVASASCIDWGFFCCKTKSEHGGGFRANTFDCPLSCYQSCNQLPVTIFFNSDPLLDPKSRILYFNTRKTSIDFGFEISDFDGSVEVVSLDFGDGVVSEGLGAKEDLITHEYTCNTSRCNYLATLMASDNMGENLLDSELNQILVIFEP